MCIRTSIFNTINRETEREPEISCEPEWTRLSVMSIPNLQWAHTVPQRRKLIPSAQTGNSKQASKTGNKLQPNQLFAEAPDSRKQCLHLQVSQRIQWETMTFFIRAWSTYKGLYFGNKVLPSNPGSVPYYLCNLRKITWLFILRGSHLLTKSGWQ